MTSSVQDATTPRLRELNSYVQLLEAPPSQTPDPFHPSVILLFGWLQARLPYLQKYIDSLRKCFPTSTIVVIRAYTSWYFTPDRWLEKGISPVVDIIRREMSGTVKFRGVLVHVLSNGGALQLISVHNALAKVSSTGMQDASHRRPPTALVLDSCPASHELESAIQSWAPSHPILHYLSIPPISIVYTAFSILNGLSGHPPLFQGLRSFLNTPNLLPSITEPDHPGATPRVYIYSDVDLVTTANDIETHCANAVSQGFDVTLEQFSGSQHVAHAKSDPDRYWRVVRTVWKKALRSSGNGQVLSSL
ncbi:uncharacterized protein B0H18DRAFT_667982 [Fomitopsis serialis]|uniref:uncharacterized protein n=1 Tax=Fomitopsis serialis TaxID=139415 RepID=UPI002008E000|nr:uncharacterized protein B0H18DRAFT_667982 [Neoantrodia serialis]KAH9918441.1 hypothetical protein B0H18DRAFT_667982 [Neoantrodia serialis]